MSVCSTRWLTRAPTSTLSVCWQGHSVSPCVCGSDRVLYSHTLLSRSWPTHLVPCAHCLSIFNLPDLYSTSLLIPQTVHLNSDMTVDFFFLKKEKNKRKQLKTGGWRLQTPSCGCFAPKNIFSHLSSADPQLSDGRQAERPDRRPRLTEPYTVFELGIARPPPSEIKRASFSSAHKTVSLLLPTAANCLQPTKDLFKDQSPVWANHKAPANLNLPTFVTLSRSFNIWRVMTDWCWHQQSATVLEHLLALSENFMTC